MHSTASLIASSLDPATRLWFEQRTDLPLALFCLCLGAVAMLGMAVIQRAVPLIRDWIREQRARVGEPRSLGLKPAHPRELAAELDAAAREVE